MTAVRPNVLMIVGAPRSGSTVFEQLLAVHGNTVAVGELRRIWNRGLVENHLCSCGDEFNDCEFWSAVMRGVNHDIGGATALERAASTLRASVDRNRFIPAMHHPLLKNASFRSNHEVATNLLESLYRNICLTSGADLVIDSSKDPSYAHLLSTMTGVDVAFLHLVRDSRAVAHSWRREKHRPEIHWEQANMERWSFTRAALDWDLKFLLSGALKAYDPRRVATITYEELARNPNLAVKQVRELLQRLHMPDLDEDESDSLGDRYHTVSGNPIRFNSGAPVLREDVAWRHEMLRRDRLTVSVLTAPFLLMHLRAVRRIGRVG